MAGIALGVAIITVFALFEKKRSIKIPRRIIVKRRKHCGRYFAGKVVSERIEDVVDVEVKNIFSMTNRYFIR